MFHAYFNSFISGMSLRTGLLNNYQLISTQFQKQWSVIKVINILQTTTLLLHCQITIKTARRPAARPRNEAVKRLTICLVGQISV